MLHYTQVVFPVIIEGDINNISYLTRSKLDTPSHLQKKHLNTHIHTHTQRARQQTAGSVLVSHVHRL